MVPSVSCHSCFRLEARPSGLQHAYWCGGIYQGVADGAVAWLAGGTKPLDADKASVEILRRRLAGPTVRAAMVDPVGGWYLDELARRLHGGLGIAGMNRVRQAAMTSVTKRAKTQRELWAADHAFQFAGGCHEGAWLSVDSLSKNPPAIKGAKFGAPAP